MAITSMQTPGRLYEQAWDGTGITFDQFMAATPEERAQYFNFSSSLGDNGLNVALRNILSNNGSSNPLTPEQYQQVLASAPAEMRERLAGGLQGVLTQQSQQRGTIADSPIAPLFPILAMGGLAMGANALGLGEAASASGGATAAAAPAAEGLASFVGPATGTVEAAPVIGAAGAPTVSAVASGAGPFVPTVLGTGAASSLSNFLAPSASTGATAAAGGSSLGNILRGDGGIDDFLRVGGAALPGLLGAYAANQQANALGELGDKYFNVGAPSRDRFEASFAPGFSMANEPGYQDALDQTTQTFLRQMSARHGNPFDSPTAWAETLKGVNATFALPQLNEYRRLNAGAGGLASLTSAAPAAQTNAVNAGANVYNALGGAAADVITPPRTLEDVLRRNGIKFSLA